MSNNGHIIHASCVAVNDNGLLIIGPSGSGKSSLARELLAIGASLIADDRVSLDTKDGKLTASCPAPIKGLLEVRGVGIIRCEAIDSSTIRYVVDLSQPEPERLPPHRKSTILNVEVDTIYAQSTMNIASALLLLLQSGRYA